MTYEAKGVVKEVGQTRTFPSGFSKREIVVDTAERGSKYPNEVPFQAVKDRCGLLDGFRRGDEVSVTFAVDGRSFDGDRGLRRFVDLKVIKIAKACGAAGSSAPDIPLSAQCGYRDGQVETDDGMPF